MQQKMWKGCVLVTKIDVKVVVARDQVSTRIGNYCHLFAKRTKKKMEIRHWTRCAHAALDGRWAACTSHSWLIQPPGPYFQFCKFYKIK